MLADGHHVRHKKDNKTPLFENKKNDEIKKKSINYYSCVLIFLVLAGITAGSVYYFGFRSQDSPEEAENQNEELAIEILEGQMVQVPNTNGALSIKNHDFNIQYEPATDESGQLLGYLPTRYFCDLELFENGVSVLRKTAEVRHENGEVIEEPMRYEDYTFSITTYNSMQQSDFRIVVTLAVSKAS